MILRNARLPGDPNPVDIRISGSSRREAAHRDLEPTVAIVPAGAPRPADADDEVDLEGRWVVPGLWDHHVHFAQYAMATRRLDVSAATSAAHAAALVRDRIAEAPPESGTVLIGQGFRDGLWPDVPTPELLDVGDVPVVLISGDVHCTWANAAALRLLDRPVEHWLLREQPAFDLQRQLSDVPDDVLDGWVLDAARDAARRGVVGIGDFEMAGGLDAWVRRFGTGFRGIRVRQSIYPHAIDAAAGFRTGDAVGGSGLLEVGPLKLFADGSLNTRTAWCHDPYPGTGDVGLPTYTPEELLAVARDGVARGLTPTIHAIGDAAVTLALDTFAALGAGGQMEHAQLVADADLPRFAALGVVASVQPEHAMDDRDIADRYWSGRTARSFPYRSLLDAGARLVFGSDAPVAPLDPWVTMDAAVTRSRDGREPWHPEQAVPVAAALAASTRTALADGEPADLAVVEGDPFTTPLRAMPVAATMLAGRWTHTTLPTAG